MNRWNDHSRKSWSRMGFLGSLTIAMLTVSWGTSWAQDRDSREPRAINKDARASYSAGVVPLDSLVARVREINPTVREGYMNYVAAREAVNPAGTLPNPQAQLTYFLEHPETRVGPQNYAFTISQRFPFWGKLSSREQKALFEATARREQWIAKVLNAVAGTKKAYFDLCYIDAAIEITKEDQNILTQFEEISRKRYITGQGIEQAVIKLQVELTRDRDRLISLKKNRIAKNAVLNSFLDRNPTSESPACVLPDPPSALPEYATLIERALQVEPEYRAAWWAVQGAAQGIRYAKRDFFPDVTAGFSFIGVGEREDPAGVATPPGDNGKNAYGVTVGLSIPLWFGKQKDSLDRAKAERQAREQGFRSVRNGLEAKIQDVTASLQSLGEQIRLYEKVLLVQAEEALESAKAAYTTGKLGALDLIDAERVVLAVRLAHARLRADFWKAYTDAERWSGTALEEKNAILVVEGKTK